MIELLAYERWADPSTPTSMETLKGQAIVGCEWEFALRWTAETAPKVLLVNEKPLREWLPSDPSVMEGEWNFTLPSTAHGRISVIARSVSGSEVVHILNVLTPYQPPDHLLTDFGRWVEEYRLFLEVYGSTAEGFTIYDLVQGDETVESRSEESDSTAEELFIEQRELLASLFGEVLRAPNARLIGDSDLVEPGEVRRVTATTIDYFMRHPETWERRGLLRPRPVKLLNERTIEDYDVHENRFVLHFVEQLIQWVGAIIHRDEAVAEEFVRRIPEMEIEMALSVLVGHHERIERLKKQEDQLKKKLRGSRRFLGTLRRIQASSLFDKVNPLRGAASPNTVLYMHPVYGRLYALYQTFKQLAPHEKVEWLEEDGTTDLDSIYRALSFLTLVKTVVGLNFVPDDGGRISGTLYRDLSRGVSVAEGAGGTPLSISFHLRSRPTITATLSYAPPDAPIALRRGIKLVLGHHGPDGSRRHIIWLLPELMWWGDPATEVADKRGRLLARYEALLQLHERLADEAEGEGVTILMLHPTPPGNFDERLDYPELRMLFQHGDNLVTPEAHRQWGGYRVGAIPLYPAEGKVEQRLQRRLGRMIRIHCLAVGVEDYCWHCSSKASRSSERGLKRYRCQNSGCGLRWGEVHCRKCNQRYFKLKVPERDTGSVDLSSTCPEGPGEAFAIAEAIEGRLALASVCENRDGIDDFWAVCPYCGHCEKERPGSPCYRCESRRSG